MLSNFTVTPDSGIAPLEIKATFNLTNTDMQQREYTAILYVNGTIANTIKVTVDPMTTIGIELDAQIPRPGFYNVTVNNMTPYQVNVLENPNIAISNVIITPKNGTAPLNMKINVTVANTGDLAGDYTITLYKDNIAWDTRTVNIPGHQNLTISMDKTLEEPGTYNLNVNNEAPITVEVYEPPLTITGYTVQPQSGAAPLTIQALLNVTNPYDKVRSYTAKLYIDNILVQEKSNNIKPGDTWEVEMKAMLTVGSHNVRINDLQVIIVNVIKPAEFTLSNLTVTPTSGSAPLNITVTAKVTNTGDMAGNYTAKLYVDAVLVSTKTVNVAANSASIVTFDHVLEEPGNYLVGVSYLQPINVRVLKPPVFIISNFTVTPESGVAPLNINASALIRNLEESSGNYTAKLYINGIPSDTRKLNIMGYGSAIITFNTILKNPGIYTINIDDSPTSTVNVLKPAEFIIQDFNVKPSQGIAPLLIEATATIKNVGDIAGNYIAKLYVQGIAIAVKTINIAANSNTTIKFNYTLTGRGNYSVCIGNSTPLNVNVLKSATFQFINFNVTPTSGVAPLNVTVAAKLTNTGDIAGDYTAQLKINNQIVDEKTITVPAGQTVTVEFNWTLQAGTYNVTIGNLTPVTVTVASAIKLSDLVAASKSVKSYYERYGKLPTSITIVGQKYTMAQLLYLLAKAAVNINAGNLNPIMPKIVAAPISSSGSYRHGRLYKSEYLKVASNILNYMNSYGRAPNYATTSLGRIPFTRLVYIYSKIITYYGTYKRLPSYVTT